MLGTRQGSDSWTGKIASAVVAVSLLVGASVVAPPDVVAARTPKQEPVVQALVQLPDEEVDWTKLLPNVDEAPGANMVITASTERGGKPSLGASIAMERLKFPVMMQLFPKNVVGGASWPSDFEEKGTYSVEVVVCGAGRTTGGVCEVPLPIVGSGESIFVTGLDDVPEIAESGGMRVPATIILTSPSEKVLAPPT
eukprot:g16793.t1